MSNHTDSYREYIIEESGKSWELPRTLCIYSKHCRGNCYFQWGMWLRETVGVFRQLFDDLILGVQLIELFTRNLILGI